MPTVKAFARLLRAGVTSTFRRRFPLRGAVAAPAIAALAFRPWTFRALNVATEAATSTAAATTAATTAALRVAGLLPLGSRRIVAAAAPAVRLKIAVVVVFAQRQTR